MPDPYKPDPGHAGGGMEKPMRQVEIVAPVWRKLRAERPLIQNVTNFVVMNLTANALLAVGASPAMVHAPEEAGEFVRLASALVVNIGTIDATFAEGMRRAAGGAREAGIPWLLDPVGVGATQLRRDITKELLAFKPAIIRGNASEIMALAGEAAASKGVDSGESSESALRAAHALHEATGAVVAITGLVDHIISQDGVASVEGGHPLSQSVTGTGCMASALVGACLAVAPPPLAALAGLTLMKGAAEQAARDAEGPGSFAVRLIDALALLSDART
jgi:hydroxyethylthiazole kinase